MLVCLPEGGGGPTQPPPPPEPTLPPTPRPPPLCDWAKFSSGPSVNQKFCLGPSAPISFRQNFCSACSAPRKIQHHLVGGGVTPTPQKGALIHPHVLVDSARPLDGRRPAPPLPLISHKRARRCAVLCACPCVLRSASPPPASALSQPVDARVLTACTALLKNGAQVNRKGLYGMTALHVACRHGSLEIVDLLLRHGASLSATTDAGHTPLLYAESHDIINRSVRPSTRAAARPR